MNLADWHQRYLQQSQWTTAVRRHLFAAAGLRTGDRVLEVGCGTGAVLSRVAGEGSCDIFGMDIDRPSLAFAKDENKTFRLAQADGHRLPFPDGAFNAVFCHYLLLWVADPVQVLAEMCRATRPGGAVIALAEPDHAGRIDAPPPLDQAGQWQTRALASQGADVTLGRQLRCLFHQAGLAGITSGLLGAEWDHQSKPDPSEWQVVRDDLEGLVSEVNLAAYAAADRQAREEGTRVLFIPTFYALGRVPG